jgi:predicted GH43/DUF377 family glycosyl hydrolase
MPDLISLVRYWTSLSIISFSHSDTGLIQCQTVRHSGIYAHEQAHEHLNMYTHMCTCTRTDTDKWYEHGHASWTWRWTSTMDDGIQECG